MLFARFNQDKPLQISDSKCLFLGWIGTKFYTFVAHVAFRCEVGRQAIYVAASTDPERESVLVLLTSGVFLSLCPD